MEKQGCIYMGTINEKSYIGFTIDFPERKKGHERAMGEALLFHRAINKYGAENIEWVILHEYIPQSKLGEWETWWIAFKETQSPNGYNLKPGGNGGWPPHTEESKRKISESGRGRKHPPGTGEKIGNAHRGMKRSEKARKNMSIAQQKYHAENPGHGIGSKHSDETKRKISEARKGTKATAQARRNMSEAQQRRKPATEETRRKISRAHTGMKRSEQARRNMAKAQQKRRATETKRKHSDETKRKMSIAAKRRWAKQKAQSQKD